MPLWLIAIILGVVALVVSYTITSLPPDPAQLIRAIGWVLVSVGLIVFVYTLLIGGGKLASTSTSDLVSFAMIGAVVPTTGTSTRQAKLWYQSKTVWFNIVVFLIAVLDLQQIVTVLPPWLLPYDTAVGAIGNLALRMFFTEVPVSTGQPQSSSEQAPQQAPTPPLIGPHEPA